ncbi:hypothetical protein BLNAU_24958 [Blattamonas nauphoetae]|uniref:Uncharacterized protein n=1 Tax=Blattamonas nauphoetae TaxID=2049346 RepID=A0ABQ9WL00_9EUKA|nr:hypothetical protein BLNAU_24958 [Blattamonas nauphoetae]
MGNSSYSANRHRDSTRLFLSFNPHNVRTIEQASRFFLSLVAFVQEGNELDDVVIYKACALLKWIKLFISPPIHVTQILFKLAPTPDGSCTGFVESLVLLLTSSNEAIVLSTLSFLTKFGSELRYNNFVHFLNSGFFALLPDNFYTNEMHLTPRPDYFLMNIVASLLREIPVGRHIVFSGSMNFPVSTFIEIPTDNFLHPIKPFLKVVFQHRRRLEDTDTTTSFSTLLGAMARSSQVMEQMAQFVLSSSFALTYTDSLIFFETNKSTITLLASLLNVIKEWPESDPAVRKRGRQIRAQLEEEGISDEIELHMRHLAIYPSRFEMRIFEHQILNWSRI